LNLTVLKRRVNGRAEGTPTLFAFVLQGNPGNSARLRALICFGGGGASQSFQRNFLMKHTKLVLVP